MAGGPKAARMALGIGVWLWVAALFLAPAALRQICGVICHQRPERSFSVAGTQMPVCARCTGLYVGAALAVLAASGTRLAKRRSAPTIAAPLASARARWILVAAAVPTAVTWVLEAAGLVAFSNAARFAAALPLGLAAAWLVVTAIDQSPNHQIPQSSSHHVPRSSV